MHSGTMQRTHAPAEPSHFASDADCLAAIDEIRSRVPQADPLKHLPDVDPRRIPRHVAIIMDGNGRWAQERGFPRMFGHRNGAASVRAVVGEAGRCGVEVLTLYSFSMENWKRPSDEVRALMSLCVAYCDGEREAFVREGVKFRVVGRRDNLPGEVVEAIERVEDATKDIVGPTLCLAINYGSRAEMTNAVRTLARKAAAGEIDEEIRAALEDEIADVAIYLIRLADVLGVDVGEAVRVKLERNEGRFPAGIVRGKAN